MKRISLFLAIKQIAALTRLSKKTGIGFAEHVRRAIDQYLTKK